MGGCSGKESKDDAQGEEEPSPQQPIETSPQGDDDNKAQNDPTSAQPQSTENDNSKMAVKDNTSGSGSKLKRQGSKTNNTKGSLKGNDRTKVHMSVNFEQLPDGNIKKTVRTTMWEKNTNGSWVKSTKEKVIFEKAPPKEIKLVPSTAPHVSMSLTDAVKMRKTAKRVPCTTAKEFLDEALVAHNRLRAKHGIGELTLDEDMCQVAQAWANELANVIGKMLHSKMGFGENIFWSESKTLTATHVIEGWYSEISKFNWKKIDKTIGCGHFTQLLWASSKKMGIALAKGKTGFYCVAIYMPPGNVNGRYPENIFLVKN